MTHEEAAARLDDYLDGTLDPATKAEVDAHLIACPVCRDELTVLQSILADARALPRSVMPARDLWDGIERRLGTGRAIGRSGGHREQSEAISRLTARYRIPLLAAAAIALVMSGVGLATLLRQPTSSLSTFELEQRRYAQVSAQMARQIADNPGLLLPSTRAVVERNLAIVDSAINEAQQALTTDPGNTALEQMVLARYEQRLALLRRATDAGRRAS